MRGDIGRIRDDHIERSIVIWIGNRSRKKVALSNAYAISNSLSFDVALCKCERFRSDIERKHFHVRMLGRKRTGDAT